MWDNVPWMVGGGVSHSVEVCRLLAYVASGGREGIVGAQDLEVTAQATPGASVRIWPGACSIIDRDQANAYGAYTAQKLATETLNIAPTTGSGARSDLIIARIRNPYRVGSPWPDPGSDPAAKQAYQYIETVAVPVTGSPKSVKQAGLAYSAIALARIDMPAGASTVLQSYIKDLRKVIAANSDTATNSIRPAAARTLTSSSYANWPSDGNFSVDVPEWATHVNLRALLGGISFGPGNVKGSVRVVLNDSTAATPGTAYDESSTGADRTLIMASGDDIRVPVAWRGTTKTIKIEGYKSSGTTSLVAQTVSTVEIQATWRIKPDTNL